MSRIGDIVWAGLRLLGCLLAGTASAACAIPSTTRGVTSIPAGETLPALPTEMPGPKSSTTGPLPTETGLPPSPTLIPYTTPQWFQGAVLYEIFVRSFADSDGDSVGDLDGVTQRLDYIQDLGATAIWLMPIHPSPSVHGYDVLDYQAVNPDYGSLADLQELVEAAHARGIRVLLDFVPSHLSNQNILFQDAYGNPASDYADWFVFTNEAHTQYAGFAGNREMPRFNHYNPEVVAFLSEAARFWLDLDSDGDFSDGVDGFRVDNATFPPQEFLVALRQAVKSANPEALLLGEIWVTSPGDLGRFYSDQFDALFDFPLFSLIQGDHNTNGDGLLAGKGFPTLIDTLLDEERRRFPPEAMAVRFVSNHDTNRIATEVDEDPDRERLAATLLAALPGPSLIYYGEEIGMRGQKGGPPHWDNYRREPMDWYADEQGPEMASWFRPEDRWNAPGDGISVEEQDSNPESLLNYYRRVLTLRQTHPAMQAGDIQSLSMQSSGQGTWAIRIDWEDDTLVLLVNFADDLREVTLDSIPLTGQPLTDLLSGASFPAAEPGQAYPLKMPGSSALLLTLSP